MDIRKGKIDKVRRVFDKLFNKSNTYIPAMHENKPDTFEKTVPHRVDSLAENPPAIKNTDITRESVIAKLKTIDWDSEFKSQFIERIRTPEQINVADKFLSNQDLYTDSSWSGLLFSKLETINSPQKADLFNKILLNPILYENENLKRELDWYSHYDETPEQVEAQNSFIDKYLSSQKMQENQFLNDELGGILFHISSFGDLKSKIEVINILLENPALLEKERIKEMLKEVLRFSKTQEQFELAKTLLSEPILYENPEITDIAGSIVEFMNREKPKCEKAKLDILKKYISNPKLNQNKGLQKNIGNIVVGFNYSGDVIEEKYKLVDKYLSDPNLYEDEDLQEKMAKVFSHITSSVQIDMVNKFFSEPTLFNNEELREELPEIIRMMGFDERYKKDAHYKIDFLDNYYLTEPKLLGNSDVQNGIGKILSSIVCQEQYDAKAKFLDVYLSNPDLNKKKEFQENLTELICSFQTQQHVNLKFDLIDKYLSNPKYLKNEDMQKCIAKAVIFTCSSEHKKYADKLIDEVVNKKISPAVCNALFMTYRIVDPKKIRKLGEMMTNEDFEAISKNYENLKIASEFIGLCGKNSVNEISIVEKKNILRKVIEKNTNLFNISEEMKKPFPLLPRNREEYCSFVPELVKSLGIETKPLSAKEHVEFDSNLQSLATVFKKLPISAIDNLSVNQSYSKDAFIQDALLILKDLSDVEKQKVYDYFGFELHNNIKAPTGYTIVGYPLNINNGAKLQEISEEKTKQAIETLREKVISFSEYNCITSNIPEIDDELNTILNMFPELRTTIGRNQYGAHNYDVFKHSLKVMHSIVQTPEFETLNESDKKLMLLCSLFHDISKVECLSDPMHPMESSFDTFYITKKLNLTHDERIKLYTLINYHQWSKYVNNDYISEEEKTQRLQSVAFDLQNEDLFKMSKLFAIADIKSIKSGNGLYDNFASPIEKYSARIEKYVAELKKTKPILPTTKLPKASEVASKITVVNPDSSTNLKGVYKKDGIVIVKYNEIENWEELGFSQGSVSSGIKVPIAAENKEINTGNIKFIAHGLDYENQLINFDAFALPDSDALLSVSYMERPESKYRLFRPQGVLLDVDSKYIYGGGRTDSGSGYKKSISNFKKDYIFGGEREKDREFISDLIKETLNLSDEEYVDFVKKNSNKSMAEIEPIEAREALIKNFALINSTKREHNREYNEMYVSNPTVQGVYAYDMQNDKVGEIGSFMDSQPAFLKEYAKQNDLLFFVFGD